MENLAFPLIKRDLVPTNIEGYSKDLTSGVLINSDESEYQKILALREKKRADRQIVRDIDELKNDMAEIKELLKLALGQKIN
jgi:hypothetical protein